MRILYGCASILCRLIYLLLCNMLGLIQRVMPLYVSKKVRFNAGLNPGGLICKEKCLGNVFWVINQDALADWIDMKPLPTGGFKSNVNVRNILPHRNDKC